MHDLHKFRKHDCLHKTQLGGCVGNRYVWVDYHTHCGPSFSFMTPTAKSHTTQWTKTTLFGPHLEHGWQGLTFEMRAAEPQAKELQAQLAKPSFSIELLADIEVRHGCKERQRIDAGAALYFEAVQTQRKCNAQQQQELLSEMVEIVAEERGAFWKRPTHENQFDWHDFEQLRAQVL